MPRYEVNATLDAPCWVTVIADDPESALDEARGMSADSFEYDLSAATVEFNVVPAVELL